MLAPKKTKVLKSSQVFSFEYAAATFNWGNTEDEREREITWLSRYFVESVYR